MNPDVFITVVFAAISLVVALVALVLVRPLIRREAARVERLESGGAGKRSRSRDVA